VPAAAVIPAPKAYVQIAAVKKLVVGGVAWPGAPPAARRGRARLGLPSSGGVPQGARAARRAFRGARVPPPITLNKLECLRQASRCE
jgi:hypothetical protein